MFKREPNYQDWLAPYLEGELDAARASEVQARLAADPALAAEAERLRRTMGHLRESASRASETTAGRAVPADLWPRLRARLEPAPPPRRPAQVWWMAGVGATAALALAAIWLPMQDFPKAPAQPSAPKSSRAASAPTEKPNPSALPPPRTAPLAAKAGGSRNAAGREEQVAAAPQSDPFAVPNAPVAAVPDKRVSLPPVPPPAAKDEIKSASANKPTLMASRSLKSRIADGVTDAPTTFALPPVAAPPAPPAEPAPMPVPSPAAPAVAAAPAPAIRLNRAEAGSDLSLSTQTEQQTKSQPNTLYQSPGPVFGQSGAATNGAATNGAAAGMSQMNALAGPARMPAGKPRMALAPQNRALLNARRDRIAKKTAPMPAAILGAQAADADSGQSLDNWQKTLAQTAQMPLLGDDAGMQQANQALMAAREAGGLDTLRARLEAKEKQSPQDIVTARMLAAVYDFGFASEPALRERRRLVGLDGATGEDWFALAQAEERAGNGQAAQSDYRRALNAPAPLSSFHTALARQRE